MPTSNLMILHAPGRGKFFYESIGELRGDRSTPWILRNPVDL